MVGDNCLLPILQLCKTYVIILYFYFKTNFINCLTVYDTMYFQSVTSIAFSCKSISITHLRPKRINLLVSTGSGAIIVDHGYFILVLTVCILMFFLFIVKENNDTDD